MTDQSPDLRGEAVGPHYARPTRGRHAVPRTSALTRLRLPLGKALALTALPTVLVLASQRPPAADATATAAHSAPEEAPAGGVDCARPDDSAVPATAPPATPPHSLRCSRHAQCPHERRARRAVGAHGRRGNGPGPGSDGLTEPDRRHYRPRGHPRFPPPERHRAAESGTRHESLTEPGRSDADADDRGTIRRATGRTSRVTHPRPSDD